MHSWPLGAQDELERIAGNHNGTITQAALNYLLRKPGVSSVITGARTREQLADTLKTTDWEMTAEEVKRLFLESGVFGACHVKFACGLLQLGVELIRVRSRRR